MTNKANLVSDAIYGLEKANAKGGLGYEAHDAISKALSVLKAAEQSSVHSPDEGLAAENAELRAERDALLQRPIDLAKMDSIDDDLGIPDKMVAYYWWQQAQDARAALSAIITPTMDEVEPSDLVRQWQEESHEWFKRDIAEIVEDFAKWMLVKRAITTPTTIPVSDEVAGTICSKCGWSGPDTVRWHDNCEGVSVSDEVVRLREALEQIIPLFQEFRDSIVESHTYPVNDMSTLDPEVAPEIEAMDSALTNSRTALDNREGGGAC